MKCHVAVAVAVIFASAATSLGSSGPRPPDDAGVVCLDVQTGEAIWEYFPYSTGDFELVNDGRLLYLKEREPPRYFGSTISSTPRPLRVYAIDPESGGDVTVVSDAPPRDQWVSGTTPYYEPVTASGNRVVGHPGFDRAITVMRGTTNEVLRVISTNDFYWRFVVRGDVVVYASSYHGRMTPSGPTMAAVDTNSGRELWSIPDAGRTFGLNQSDGIVYVAEHEALRAVDPQDGRTLWQEALPRIQGWSEAIEHEGAVYVNCDFAGEMFSQYYLYCLDAATGKIRWEYDPGRRYLALPLCFLRGRLYTRKSPHAFLASWKPTYAGNTPDEIEFTIRALHALGDQSAIPTVRASEAFLQNTPLASLPAELIASFPKAQNGMGFIRFLIRQFDERPELHLEIARMARYFIPVPPRSAEFGYSRPGFQGRPFPLSTSQKALTEAHMTLMARLEDVPIRVDSGTIYALSNGICRAPLQPLIQLHDETNDPRTRSMLRSIIFRQHPVEGSNWGFWNYDVLSDSDLRALVRFAAEEWLLEHEDLFDAWLASDVHSVETAAAGRLSQLEDPTAGLPLAVKVLNYSATTQRCTRFEAPMAALGVIAKAGGTEHISIVRGFLETMVANSREGRPDLCDSERRLFEEGQKTLRAMGVEPLPSVVQRLARVQEEPAPPGSAAQYRELSRAMHRARCAGDPTTALKTAERIVDLAENQGVKLHMQERLLAEAYELLEDWDKAIETVRLDYRENPDYGVNKLLPLLAKGCRLDEIEEIIDRSKDEKVIVQGALLLIEHDRDDKALEVLNTVLRKSPNTEEACIGVAQIHLKRNEPAKADEYMERAIALRPHPWLSPSFCYTITYWLDRGQPDKARDWMRESLRTDGDAWESDNLREWAAKHNELAPVLAEFAPGPKNPR